MNCPEERTLNDYVDGELDSAEARKVRDHLRDCADCVATIDGLTELIRSAAGLPPELLPSRDLFPAIRRSLGPARFRPARATSLRWWTALAASVLLLSAAALTASLWRGDASRTSGTERPGVAILQASQESLDQFYQAELEYIAATERLLAALEQGGDGLTAPTREIVEQNLQIIDLAIARVRLSYANEANPEQGTPTLNALYRQKIKLLWRASRLSS